MKHVPFSKNPHTQDTHFIVSDEDFEKVSAHKWYVEDSHSSRDSRSAHYRIFRTATKEERATGWPKNIKLHRFVFDIKLGQKDVFVDHMLDWLDNRKEALRLTSRTNNNRYAKSGNRRSEKNAHLPKGVSIGKSKENPFRSQICVDGKTVYIGAFPTPEKAHDAYKEAAVRHFGEFAKFE